MPLCYNPFPPPLCVCETWSTIYVFVVGNLVILLRIVQIILTKGTPLLEVNERGLWPREEFLPSLNKMHK